MASPLMPFSPSSPASLMASRTGATSAGDAAGLGARPEENGGTGAFAAVFQRSSEALQAPSVPNPGARSRERQAGPADREAPAEPNGPAAGAAAQADAGNAAPATADPQQPDTTGQRPDADSPRSRQAQRRSAAEAREPGTNARPRTGRRADTDAEVEGRDADGLSTDRPADAADEADSTAATDSSLAAGALLPAPPAAPAAAPSTLSLAPRRGPTADDSGAIPSAAPATARRTATPGLSGDEAAALGARRLPLAGSERPVPGAAAATTPTAPTAGSADATAPQARPAAGAPPIADLRRAVAEDGSGEHDGAVTTAASAAADALPDASVAPQADANGATPGAATPGSALPPGPQALAGPAAPGRTDAAADRGTRAIERSGVPGASALGRAPAEEAPAARVDKRSPRSAGAGRGTETESAGRRRDEARSAASAVTSDSAAAASAPAASQPRGDDPRGEQAGSGSSTPSTASAASGASAGANSGQRFADALQGLVPAATGTSAPAASPQAAATPLPTSQLGAHLYSPEFSPSLGAQITLLARQGVQQARIELNPADMGPITVRIAVEGSGAQVDFQADRAATRQVIESSLPALAGALRESGLTLTGGGVFQPPADGGSFAGQLGGQGPGGSGGNASGQSPGSSGSSGSSGGRPGWPGGTDERDLARGGSVLRTGLPRGLVDLVA